MPNPSKSTNTSTSTSTHSLSFARILVRGLFPLEKIPGVISLLAGKPNPDTFPITSLQVTVRSPDSSSKQDESHLEISGNDLAEGLQYGGTGGLEPLVNWFEGLQEHVHGRTRRDGWRVSMGSGSQDLLYKVSTTSTPQ